MAAVAIVCAMLEELDAVEALVTEPEPVSLLPRYPAFRGRLAGHEVICMQSGIGKVNAAMATTLLIERHQPSYLINTGIAGGVGEEVSITDIVVATELRYFDVDAKTFGYEVGQIPQMPARFECEVEALADWRAIEGHAIHSGLIVSGDSFVTAPAMRATIKKHFPQALAVDMESCAIAQVCFQLDVSMTIIRSISDKADADAGPLSEANVHTAARLSARVVEHALSSRASLGEV